MSSLLLAAALVPALINGHVSIVSGVGYANTSQEITFGTGHGCEGLDTYSIRVQIPEGVTSIRSVSSTLGSATLETDQSGKVLAVVWEKPERTFKAGDTAYYKSTLRMKLPNRPFTKLYFPTTQSCIAADGSLTTVNWTQASEPGDADAEPAPVVIVVPSRKPGWNKFAAPGPISDLATFFGDALIVWKGTAAYSSNPATLEAIKATEGVSELTSVDAGDELWVRY